MGIIQGEIWWAELPVPAGSEPGYRRPVMVIQADAFNRSRIQTVLVAVITSNLRLADAPGNVCFSRKQSNLPKDSVINVSQILTLDKRYLVKRVGKLTSHSHALVNRGLRLVMSL